DRDRRRVLETGDDLLGLLGDLLQGFRAVQILAPGEEPQLELGEGIRGVHRSPVDGAVSAVWPSGKSTSSRSWGTSGLVRSRPAVDRGSWNGTLPRIAAAVVSPRANAR